MTETSIGDQRNYAIVRARNKPSNDRANDDQA